MPKSQARTTTKKFEHDLKKGLDGENEIVKFLEKKGLKFIATSQCLYPNHYKFFDLVFEDKKGKEIKVEVKTDTFISDSYDTKNIVIEVSCNRKPSGISTSLSDLFITYFPKLSKDNIWVSKTKDLKDLIQKEKFTPTSGGDGNTARMILIPRFEYQEHFKVYSYQFKTDTIKPQVQTDPYKVTYESNTTSHKRYSDVIDFLN